MAAAATHAALSAKWVVALQSLKAVPGAAADRSLPKKALHYMASQAEVDCTCAEFNRSLLHNTYDLTLTPQLGPVLGLIVHKLQVCAHTGHSSRVVDGCVSRAGQAGSIAAS
jgi:hypothetical protein